MELEALLLSALSSQHSQLSTYHMAGRATRSRTKAAAAPTPTAPVQPAPTAEPRRRHTRANPIEENAVAPNATTNQTARRRAPAKSGTGRGKKSAKKNKNTSNESDEDDAPPNEVPSNPLATTPDSHQGAPSNEPAPAAADDGDSVDERPPTPKRPRRRPPLSTSPPPQDVDGLVAFGNELQDDAQLEDEARLQDEAEARTQDEARLLQFQEEFEDDHPLPIHSDAELDDDTSFALLHADEDDVGQHQHHRPHEPGGRTLWALMQETERRQREPVPKTRPMGQVFDEDGKFVPSMKPRPSRLVREDSDDSHAGADPGLDDSGEDSGDDYFETEKAKKERERFYDGDVDDEEDEELAGEEEEEPDDGKGKGKAKAKAKKSRSKKASGKGKEAPKRTAGKSSKATAGRGAAEDQGTSGKGKGKATMLPTALEGDGSDVEEDYSGKGPLPHACKDDVQAAVDALHDELVQLARKYNRPVENLRKLAFGKPTVPRKRQRWNMFQQWRVQVGERRGENVTKEEWNKQLQNEYHERLNTLPEDQRQDEKALDELFSDVVEWHADYKQRIVDELILTGKMDKAMGPYVKSLNQISTTAYNDLDIQIFGFIIDIHTHKSSMWGGTPEFAAWRADSTLAIHSQLADMAAIYRTFNIDYRAMAAGHLDFPKHTLVRREKETARDFGRRLITECLRRDLVRTLDDPAVKPEWSLPEMGFRHKVRISNWPEELSAENERPKKGWKPSANAVTILLPQAMRKLGMVSGASAASADEDDDASAADDDDDGDGTDEERTKKSAKKPKRVADDKLFCIESWTEAEKDLPDDEQGDVAVLVTASGTELVLVSDSLKYGKHLEKAERNEQERQRKAAEKAEKAEKKKTAAKKPTAGKTSRGGKILPQPPRDTNVSRAVPPAAPVAGPSRMPPPSAPLVQKRSRDEVHQVPRPLAGSSRTAAPPPAATSSSWQTAAVLPAPPRPPQRIPAFRNAVASSSRVQLSATNEAWGPTGHTFDGHAADDGFQTYEPAAEDPYAMRSEEEQPTKRVKTEHQFGSGTEHKRKRDEELPLTTPRPSPPPRAPSSPAYPSEIYNPRFYESEGYPRGCVGAYFPSRLPTLDMSAGERLERCWFAMPGTIERRQTRCRYQSAKKTSKEFYVNKFKVRDPDDDPETDLLASYLYKCTPDGWFPVDERLVPCEVPKHRYYREDIENDFLEPVE
ncbi:hypothetical protein R3P38DRAFT_3230549 [Favolaschia claudopus]|uniref:Uncharacterized protein n=1 Tax=Favolaschia claudopus TaxID=2862362 RepID=A0AAV9ZM48_9AGAR